MIIEIVPRNVKDKKEEPNRPGRFAVETRCQLSMYEHVDSVHVCAAAVDVMLLGPDASDKVGR